VKMATTCNGFFYARFRKEFSSLLFTVTSTALPEISIYSNSLTVSIKEKGGKPERKPYVVRNPYRNLTSSLRTQDYVHCPETSTLYVHEFCFFTGAGQEGWGPACLQHSGRDGSVWHSPLLSGQAGQGGANTAPREVTLAPSFYVYFCGILFCISKS
jgi:hypothetical protein